MERVDMICYTWQGAHDLYNGVPDLLGAVVEGIDYAEEDVTILKLRRAGGSYFRLVIKPQE
ncbi:MAG: hypothetical protein NC131_19005 [Roseburia sp.]|nr:hypothetical protein [Roseburia sp.]